jgi:hypothetical protein
MNESQDKIMIVIHVIPQTVVFQKINNMDVPGIANHMQFAHGG